MKKNIAIAIAAMMAISILITPVLAWHYNDGTEDGLWEDYGPRAGSLLMHLYADDTAEWNALKAGDIDITDWPLSKTVADELVAGYDDVIEIANYGPEYGLFILDMNCNPNQYLGNPPDPAYVNPVADQDPGTGNPRIGAGAGPANDHNPMSDVWLRRAIGYLIDRPGLIADPTIGAGFGFPMYTTMPPAQLKYLYDVPADPTIPWASQYNPAAAAALLDANGFPVNTGTGYRYWDRNTNGVEEADEYMELVFFIRSDHPGRNHIGTVLLAEMAGVNLRTNAQYATSGTCFTEVMVNKDFHIYTGGWNLGVDPDHLILWSWDYYWHPGFCYDYGGFNDPDFVAAADGIMYANTQAEAVAFAYQAQYAQANMMGGAPLYCASGNKAYYKTNVGGNPGDTSEGEAWDESIVNLAGYGLDNGFTLANMHTTGTADSTDMVIDYGFKVPEIKQLNPVYASWLYDWNVLGHYYPALGQRNATDQGEWLPATCKSFELSTYDHPVYGQCSKVSYSMRHDLEWWDGTPLTAADVEFTFVELKKILEDRGLPNPWWWSNVQDILSFAILDPSNFEVLLGVKSYWALGWISGNIILPKHIWKPICESADPQVDQPDPILVGCAGWKFVEYNDVSKYVLSVRNEYADYPPLGHKVKAHVDELEKFDLGEGLADIMVEITNKDRSVGLTFDMDVTVTYKRNGTSFTYTFTGIYAGPMATVNRNVTRTDEYGCIAVEVDIYLAGYTISSGWHREYVTIKEDIAGSTYYDDVDLGIYTYKSQLPSPDMKVDIKDVALAAKAFGSYPGADRWSTVADINSDYKIDIKDIAAIAKMFGWVG
jgi:ABC-type transport system substrate-binding protein